MAILLSIGILSVALIADVGGEVCGNKEFACSDDATCLPMEKFCDQNKDCPDGSDEPYRNSSSSYDSNTTFCLRKAKNNVDYRRICVLPFELSAHEKELCEGSTCREGEFACKDGSQCVVMNKMCDGKSYCDDGSDELPPKNDTMTYDVDTIFCRENGEVDTADRYYYYRGIRLVNHELDTSFAICVLPEEYLEHRTEICDGSSCKADEFACFDGSQCIAMHMFCNEHIDCRDKSDEPPLRNFNKSQPGSDAASCRATRHSSKRVRSVCILPPELMPLQSYICDGSSCKNDEFACLDGSRCISEELFCNGVRNCNDGSDEPPLRNNNITYDDDTIFCKGHERLGRTFVCILPTTLVSRRQRICTGTKCRRNQFRCLDGSMCLHTNYFCDGNRECRDGSDEIYRYLHTTQPSNGAECRRHYSDRICVLPPYLLPYEDKICRGSSCDSHEFTCIDGSKCLARKHLCNGVQDCEDGSDEWARRNNTIKYDTSTTFCKVATGWICLLPEAYLAYESRWCLGPSSCAYHEFACSDGSRCLPSLSLVCDGIRDCGDGSDEPGWRDFSVTYAENDTFCRLTKRRGAYIPFCNLSPALKPYQNQLCYGSSCNSDEFTCMDGSGCVSSHRICDGRQDCKDNSDEPPLRKYNASYDANVTFCRGRDGNGIRDRICVFPSTVVSQMENLCGGSLCAPDEYSCPDGSRCISKYDFCDGFRHCPDGSDEPPLYNKSIHQDGAKVTLCRGHDDYYNEAYLLCVLPTRLIPCQRALCDGSSCKMNEFSCSSGSRCIPKSRFCDSWTDCLDGSDEPYWNNSLHDDSNATRCRRFRYSESKICALSGTLASEMNEYCDGSSCQSDEFSCDHGSKCIPAGSFCDFHKHCEDGEDERDIGKLAESRDTDIYCRRWDIWNDWFPICLLPAKLAPYKDVLCYSSSCRMDEFTCANGKMCIVEHRYCDGHRDCEDGSDEFENPEQTNFTGRICARNEKKCMIPDSQICDGVSWCDNDFDECICPGNETYHLDERCFQCLSYPFLILPISKLCDRVFDCPDLTDECICETVVRPNICEKISWVANPDKTTRFPFVQCVSSKNETTILLSTTQVCDSRIDCQNDEDEIHCHSKQSNRRNFVTDARLDYECSSPAGQFATACDGIPECEDFLDEECHCEDSIPEFCSGIENHHIDPRFRYYHRDAWEPRCQRPVKKHYPTPLILNEMCDGQMHCTNYADEIGCNSRFYCIDKPLPNIPIEKKCDMQNDCQNKADEANCSHFYCGDDGKLEYISLDLVCDGVKDCQSASDECQPGCIKSAFSNEKSMITNKSILALSWIISLSALIGCSLVVAKSLRNIIKPIIARSDVRSRSEPNKLMNRLVLNLAVSDLLVGIYAFSICIKASRTNTDYCKIDREWRSSETCSALGAIMVIGSEQSVFTMVIIAAQRLYSVIRPFSKPNLVTMTIVIAISWSISIVLGIIPLIPQIEDYFVSSVGFTENRIFKVMHYQEIPYMDNWLSHLNSDQSAETGQTDWSRMRDLARKINPNITVSYEFGYYSSHTVCLPTFFPDPSMDKAWAYSFFLLLINFMSFLFMAVCYVLFYRRANKNLSMGEDKKNEESKNLQRKLTRIVISDLLCWMPICIMGFLTLNGVDMPKDVYLPTGLLIAPINSALNPLLYSDLPEIVWSKLRRIGTTKSTATQNHTVPMELTERVTAP